MATAPEHVMFEELVNMESNGTTYFKNLTQARPLTVHQTQYSQLDNYQANLAENFDKMEKLLKHNVKGFSRAETSL